MKLHSSSNETEYKNLAWYFEQQYPLIQGSRAILLDYCDNISKEDFIKQNNGFGIASMRDLLVHITNCYRAWLSWSLQKEFEFIPYEQIHSLAELRKLFEKVDKLMQEFIAFVAKEQPEALWVYRKEKRLQLTPLQLFSHVTTHEFHHKGQILSLSRHLGYTPLDTDIIQ